MSHFGAPATITRSPDDDVARLRSKFRLPSRLQAGYHAAFRHAGLIAASMIADVGRIDYHAHSRNAAELEAAMPAAGLPC